MVYSYSCYLVILDAINSSDKGRVQKPQSRKLSAKGVPPPPLPPPRKMAGQKVNGKKLAEKGGTPPPHHGHFP